MVKKIIGLTLLLFVLGTIKAQTSVEKVEASFIASFMRYVKWPKQENLKTFTIGILSKNHGIIDELNKTVNGKTIGYATINVVSVEEISDLKNCQVLFIPSGRVAKAKKMIEAAADASIMTVTEEQTYTPDIAIINFQVVNNKLTFQLNNDIALAKNISVSSKLAQMARN